MLSHQHRGKRYEGLAHQENHVELNQAVIRVAGKAEKGMVIQPQLADDNKADQPAQKLREQSGQAAGQFTGAPLVVKHRNFEIQDQERDDDCRHAVRESFNSVEAQFTLRKTTEEPHEFTPVRSLIRQSLRKGRRNSVIVRFPGAYPQEPS